VVGFVFARLRPDQKRVRIRVVARLGGARRLPANLSGLKRDFADFTSAGLITTNTR
jgi:hypothetical protein